MYRAVIFDLFGTLVDRQFIPGQMGLEFRQAMSNVAAALSIPELELHRLWSETAHERDTALFPTTEAYFQHLCRECNVSPDAAQLAHAVQLRLEYLRRALVPREDVIETLTKLRASGYKTGLASDCSLEVSYLWPETSFGPLLDVAILSCDVGLSKPDSRIYQLVCEGLQVSPERCLYVGDGGSKELTGASESGMEAVLIRAPYDTVNGNREDWPGTRVSTIKEVLELVERSEASA